MTPRPKVESDPVATATMERIRRSLDERPQRNGLQWGAIVVALFVGYLGANLAGTKSPVATDQSPQAVARATPDDIRVLRALPVEVSAPRPVGGHFPVVMPDGRYINSIVRAAVRNLGSLPKDGNQINDARYVAADSHWYIWTTPLSGGLPRWIDP